jgi:hypothetical protein
MTSHEGLRAAALVQLNGGDGMAFLRCRDPVEADAAQALAQIVQELTEGRLELLAKMIRNQIAEMLKG